jgi:ATP-dependent DNA ligase
MAFDVLYYDRRDLTGRPLRDRRARLEDVLDGSELVLAARRLASDWLAARRRVVERGTRATWPTMRRARTSACRRGRGSRMAAENGRGFNTPPG